MSREVMKYSEAFKRHVVKELEFGKVKSLLEARERYGIGGGGTVGEWVRKYGSDRIQRKVVRVETPEERDQIKTLKTRIRELEKALSETKVSETLAKAYFETLCEKFGVKDPEALKKNIERKLFGEEPGTDRGKKG